MKFIQIRADCISHKLPICPQCNDTKNLTADNGIKLTGIPEQLITCHACGVCWHMIHQFDKVN